MMRRLLTLATVVCLLLGHYALMGCDGDLTDVQIEEVRRTLAEYPLNTPLVLYRYEVLDATRFTGGTLTLESGRIRTPNGEPLPRKAIILVEQRDDRDRKVVRLRFVVRIRRDGTLGPVTRSFPAMDFTDESWLVVTVRLKGNPLPRGSEVEYSLNMAADEAGRATAG